MQLTGRRAAAVVLAAGGGLLVAAILVLVVGAVTHVDGYEWADRHRVAVDRQSTAVDVEAGRQTLIWTYVPDARLDCEVSDRDGEVPLDSVGEDYRRPGGGAGPWEARVAFEARHDLVALRCASPTGTAGPDAAVMVEPRPRLPAAFAPFGGHAAWGLGAAGLGLVLAVSAPVLLRREPRTH